MEWKEVIGSNGDYLVSDTGCVMSLKNHGKRLLKPRPSIDGYLRYSLRINGKAVEVKAHRLVAIHFIPNTEHKETVNHKDGNKKNNHVENLEWANRNEQMIHAYKMGLKKPMRGILQTDICLQKIWLRTYAVTINLIVKILVLMHLQKNIT